MQRIRFNFGPGTKISLAAVAGVFVWQWAVLPQSPPMDDLKSRVTHDVLPPLHKPEPRELLATNLTPTQRRRVQEISSKWESEKKSLLASLGDAAGQRPGRQDLASLKSNLAGYSELSRIYNVRREEAWQRALAASGGGATMEAGS